MRRFAKPSKGLHNYFIAIAVPPQMPAFLWFYHGQSAIITKNMEFLIFEQRLASRGQLKALAAARSIACRSKELPLQLKTHRFMYSL